jgi:hypothetical protein
VTGLGTRGPAPARVARLLTIMGSGETAPTMAKVHRLVVDRLADSGTGLRTTSKSTNSAADRGDVHGMLLDTPFGFQTNATEIGVRAVAYFRESVGAVLEVAGIRSASDLEGNRGDETVARMAQLPLVFSGPGSPSYALRQWRSTLVPSLLKEKLEFGGAVTFASAAALTLGSLTVPVYELYKVGEDPHWLEGLDLLRPLGLPAVLIPHYDNAEGQTHDTRYCYLGEERLSLMEAELEQGTFVLGVDEHTALHIELDSGTASVLGRGGVTVRVRGRSERIEAGETFPLEKLLQIAGTLLTRSKKNLDSGDRAPVAADSAGAARTLETGDRRTTAGNEFEVATRPEGSPLLQAIREKEASFLTARAARDAHGMLAAILGLEEELWAWRADTLQSDEMDRGRASLRSMVGELGKLGELGTRDRSEVIGPYVDVALQIRDAARREHRYSESDAVREALESLGVSVHDSAEGSTWELQRRSNDT